MILEYWFLYLLLGSFLDSLLTKSSLELDLDLCQGTWMLCRSLGEAGLSNRSSRELNRCFEPCFLLKMTGGSSSNRSSFDPPLLFVRHVLDSMSPDPKCPFSFFRASLSCLDEPKWRTSIDRHFFPNGIFVNFCFAKLNQFCIRLIGFYHRHHWRLAIIPALAQSIIISSDRIALKNYYTFIRRMSNIHWFPHVTQVSHKTIYMTTYAMYIIINSSFHIGYVTTNHAEKTINTSQKTPQ